MEGEIVVEIHNPDDIVAARKAGHDLAIDLGFTLTDVTMIATALPIREKNVALALLDYLQSRLDVDGLSFRQEPVEVPNGWETDLFAGVG